MAIIVDAAFRRLVGYTLRALIGNRNHLQRKTVPVQMTSRIFITIWTSTTRFKRWGLDLFQSGQTGKTTDQLVSAYLAKHIKVKVDGNQQKYLWQRSGRRGHYLLHRNAEHQETETIETEMDGMEEMKWIEWNGMEWNEWNGTNGNGTQWNDLNEKRNEMETPNGNGMERMNWRGGWVKHCCGNKNLVVNMNRYTEVGSKDVCDHGNLGHSEGRRRKKEQRKKEWKEWNEQGLYKEVEWMEWNGMEWKINTKIEQGTTEWKPLLMKFTIQYGGSVKADNAKEIFSMPDVDGDWLAVLHWRHASLLTLWRHGLIWSQRAWYFDVPYVPRRLYWLFSLVGRFSDWMTATYWLIAVGFFISIICLTTFIKLNHQRRSGFKEYTGCWIKLANGCRTNTWTTCLLIVGKVTETTVHKSNRLLLRAMNIVVWLSLMAMKKIYILTNGD